MLCTHKTTILCQYGLFCHQLTTISPSILIHFWWELYHLDPSLHIQWDLPLPLINLLSDLLLTPTLTGDMFSPTSSSYLLHLKQVSISHLEWSFINSTPRTTAHVEITNVVSSHAKFLPIMIHLCSSPCNPTASSSSSCFGNTSNISTWILISPLCLMMQCLDLKKTFLSCCCCC